MPTLELRAIDWTSKDRWRWLLTDAAGNPLADHQVEVDRGAVEFAGFVDLYRFVRRYADADRRVASEAELTERIGHWITENVLGRNVIEAMTDRAPATVRVLVPAAAEWLIYRPWELARADGGALATQDVSLVYEVEGDHAREKSDVEEALRLLAVFSLPSTAAALALRRERIELANLVRELRARGGRRVELTALQYGVTRARLKDAALAGAGWDVLHISGHGLADGLLLEHDDGSDDLVTTERLVALLRPARPRIKLVVLSSCQSGAATAAQTLRWLRLDDPAAELDAEADAEAGKTPSEGVASLGRALTRELDAAVVAMRFPVTDEFAIAFGRELYDLVLDRGQAVDNAVRLALPDAAGDTATAGRPALSVGTPALFGRRAVGLSLAPPTGAADFDPGAQKLAAFDAEPQRFVGRAEPMARANAALAPRSGRSGVLFHGMAGAGKTTCALELAYGHENAFSALAFWAAPDRSEEALASLPQFAQSLENQLGEGFTMVHAVASTAELEAYLPRLTELLEQQGILLVLDNLETLLTSDGTWRDPRWELVVRALTGHQGQSRVVLTSRVVPRTLDTDLVPPLPVHALSLAESVLLARELPHLGPLMLSDGAAGDQSGRELARRAIRLVQGHPKLLELVDAAAADPPSLERRLEEAGELLGSQDAPLDAFFATGRSALDPDHYVEAVREWTLSTLETMPAASKDMFIFLSCLEDADRTSLVVDSNWPDLWQALERPGEPPSIDATLGPLQDAALVDIQTYAREGAPQVYSLHPGIAESVRDAGDGIRPAVDRELSAYWLAVGAEAHQRRNVPLLAYAAVSAQPYLMRREAWEEATALIERASLDPSPRTSRRLLPFLRHVAEATKGTSSHVEVQAERLLGYALKDIDPHDAEQRLKHARELGHSQDDARAVSVVTTDLINFYITHGRFKNALALNDEQIEHNERLGNERSELIARAQRLQILGKLGDDDRVLEEFDAIERRTRDMGEASDEVPTWRIREVAFGAAQGAALRLKLHKQALALNAEVLQSKRQRRVEEFDYYETAYNDIGPLLALGRIDEADELADACQRVFEAAGATNYLGRVFGARARIETKRGHLTEALRLAHTALRLSYVQPEPHDIQATHTNIAGWLLMAGRPRAAVAHAAAAATLARLAGMASSYAVAMRNLDGHRDLEAVVPQSLDEMIEEVEGVEGVRVGELLAFVAGERPRLEHAFAEVVADIYDHIARPPEALARWEPVLVTLRAAAAGDEMARTFAREALAQAERTADWRQLAAVLQNMLQGDRNPALLEGLDAIDAAIARRALDALEGRIELDTNFDDAVASLTGLARWDELIPELTRAAEGDQSARAIVDGRLAGAEEAGWHVLVDRLRRILAGARGDDLLDGLDEVDTLVVKRVLAALAASDVERGR